MNIPLFLLVAAVVFACSLLVCYFLSKKKDTFSAVLTSLILSIISGIFANVVSHEITNNWMPSATEPEASISITERITSDELDISVQTEALNQDILDKRPGETFLYGRYEQDEGKEGEEPIEWIVLAKEEDRMLVISKLGLDARPYNMSGESSTWESSSIRAWLKDEFYFYAFSDEEKAHILLTENYADDDTDAPRKQGKDTSDYVFLLSITEANQYIKNNVSLEENDDCCKPSRYAYDKVEIISSNSCWWWLRTSAEQGKCACSINSDGTVNYGTRGVSWKQGAVRPAMWINLK